jgi:hypothetical protein
MDVGYREYLLEDLMQPVVISFVGSHIGLKEIHVRPQLDFQEVWHFDGVGY